MKCTRLWVNGIILIMFLFVILWLNQWLPLIFAQKKTWSSVTYMVGTHHDTKVVRIQKLSLCETKVVVHFIESQFSTKGQHCRIVNYLYAVLSIAWLLFSSLLPKVPQKWCRENVRKILKTDPSLVCVCVCAMQRVFELRRTLFMASVDLKGAATNTHYTLFLSQTHSHFLIW